MPNFWFGLATCLFIGGERSWKDRVTYVADNAKGDKAGLPPTATYNFKFLFL
jgi:hypothetical protein